MRLTLTPPTQTYVEDLYEIRGRPPVHFVRLVRARNLPPLIYLPKKNRRVNDAKSEDKLEGWEEQRLETEAKERPLRGDEVGGPISAESVGEADAQRSQTGTRIDIEV